MGSTGRFKFPERIGPYRVAGLIGQGGMGAVLEAHDERATGRRVAIKLLLQGREAPAAARQRFLREGASLAKVRHHNVVRVHEAGEHEGLPYLVLELVEGESLQSKLARSGPLQPEEVARIGAEVADALQAAHDLGVLHRDLKPDNILLEASGRALLTDFGLAKDLDRLGETQRLTQSSVYLGTPGYWSPEQASGKPGRIQRASDVFGLGSTLHGLLSGGPPFDADTFLALVVRTMEEDPNPLPAHVPPGLRAVISKCMEKEPSARYPSASMLSEDLRRVAEGQLPLHAQLPPAPTSRKVIAGLIVAIAVVLAIPLFYVEARAPRAISPAPSASRSPTPNPSLVAQHWERHRAGLQANDLEVAASALASAFEAENPEARAALEERWIEVRLSAPRGPQVRLEFIDHDPPLLALLGVQFVVYWDLRDVRAAPQRVLIPAPGLPAIATGAPRLTYLQGSEVVVHEAGAPGRMIWKRPLLLGDYDVLAISPKGTRIAYTGGGRVYVEDVIRKWEPVSLPTGVRPSLTFLDEDRICALAGNVDPSQPGWAGLLDLSQRPLRVEVRPFSAPGPAGNPSWLLGSSKGWTLAMSQALNTFLAVPPAGQPFSFDYDAGDEGEREAPPFAIGGTLRAPRLVALRKPFREGTPLEVLAIEDGRVRALMRRVVSSGSDAIAISPDQTMIATGDGTEGAVYVYLTGGRSALR